MGDAKRAIAQRGWRQSQFGTRDAESTAAWKLTRLAENLQVSRVGPFERGARLNVRSSPCFHGLLSESSGLEIHFRIDNPRFASKHDSDRAGLD